VPKLVREPKPIHPHIPAQFASYAWQGTRGWKCPVIIDNMMNLELLFEATALSGDSIFYKLVREPKPIHPHIPAQFASYALRLSPDHNLPHGTWMEMSGDY